MKYYQKRSRGRNKLEEALRHELYKTLMRGDNLPIDFTYCYVRSLFRAHKAGR